MERFIAVREADVDSCKALGWAWSSVRTMALATGDDREAVVRAAYLRVEAEETVHIHDREEHLSSALDAELSEYARLAAADNDCEVLRAIRMMCDEPGEVAANINAGDHVVCTAEAVQVWCTKQIDSGNWR